MRASTFVFLDVVGLTFVFITMCREPEHAWWFVGLVLILVADFVRDVCAALEE